VLKNNQNGKSVLKKMELALFERVRKIRESINMSQLEFAQLFDLSQRTISNWESGRNEPPFIFFQKMVKNYSVNSNWLLTGDGEMFDSLNQIDIPTRTKSYFIEAIKASEFNAQEIDAILSKYILIKYLKSIKEIQHSEGIWERIFFTPGKNIAHMRILTRALIEAKEIYKNEIFTVENSKNIFKQILSQYELRMGKDKINNLINEKTREELLDWADKELNDFVCFVMLSGFDVAIAAIKETLNRVDQANFKLD
jgi:transcriptional regulator with XRE-family HTH domain